MKGLQMEREIITYQEALFKETPELFITLQTYSKPKEEVVIDLIQLFNRCYIRGYEVTPNLQEAISFGPLDELKMMNRDWRELHAFNIMLDWIEKAIEIHFNVHVVAKKLQTINTLKAREFMTLKDWYAKFIVGLWTTMQKYRRYWYQPMTDMIVYIVLEIHRYLCNKKLGSADSILFSLSELNTNKELRKIKR